VALQKAQRAAFCLAQPCQAQRAASWLASLHAVGFSVGRIKKVEEKTKSHLPEKKHRETDPAFCNSFLQLQEFSLREQTQVASSNSAARHSSRSSRAKLAWLFLRQQPYV
jgi:hypothetical protein